VPATPPPRSLMVTACSPLPGKRGPGPPSWASAGSSGGRSSSSLFAGRQEGAGDHPLLGAVACPHPLGEVAGRLLGGAGNLGAQSVAPSEFPRSGDPALHPLGEAAWCDGIMILRLLQLLRLAAGIDDYDYDKGRYLFFRLVAQGRRTS